MANNRIHLIAPDEYAAIMAITPLSKRAAALAAALEVYVKRPTRVPAPTRKTSTERSRDRRARLRGEGG